MAPYGAPMGKRLTDNEVHQTICEMAQKLKDKTGAPLEAETVHGQAALETVAKLSAVALAILWCQNTQEDEFDGL